MTFSTIADAINDFKDGKFLIICDDEDRENEGDFAIAAEFVTPEVMNFLATHARGLICMPCNSKRLDVLNMGPMVGGTHLNACKFTVSVDYKFNTESGISASDRATTVHAILDRGAIASDFDRPGHLFPLRAEEEGVLKRRGHTEASVDMARLAGLYPAAVICEIMNGDGSMARVPDLIGVSMRFGIKMITIADLVAFREQFAQQLENKPLISHYTSFLV